jgi:signal transduction histidine kinase
VISGSILTYFSITGISNLKEITEKRILEEQQELASRFDNAIEKKMEIVILGIIKELKPSESMKDSLIKKATNYNFISQSFILKNNDSFIYPHFVEIFENRSAPKFSTKFKSNFREGQKAEFFLKNLKIAKKQYLSCLRYSSKSKDSVKALNSLGRVSVKLNEHKNAVNHYKLIVLNYFSKISEDGIPYVYFAVPQLLKITNPDNSEKIFPIIKFFLEKMEAGFIPLNYNSEELLVLINKWIQANSFNSLEDLTYIDKLIKNINKQLQFVSKYRDILLDDLTKSVYSNQLKIGNDIIVINPVVRNNKFLLIINTNFINPSGFLIDGEKLFNSIIKSDLTSDFEFEYDIGFSTEIISNTSEDDLIYTSRLNTYFPQQILQIKLKDKNLINDFINSRSWTYGIATVLFLVALFLGVALIVRDIAREKNLAHLQSNFISNVTHELKTPLTSIYMFTEMVLLKRVKNESDRDEYLSIILKESERLKRMINNILDFSKLEKGKQKYHFVRSKLASIIDEAINEMDYWFENDNFDITRELNENLYAKVDAEKLKQVMGNLLSNAYKYSTHNKKIDIRLYKKMKEIYIEVEDHGIGIPEDQLHRIFEKFYRVDQKEGISGTGLGLTVVKEIVEAHGGKISVSSKIGKGSKISITLNHQIIK